MAPKATAGTFRERNHLDVMMSLPIIQPRVSNMPSSQLSVLRSGPLDWWPRTKAPIPPETTDTTCLWAFVLGGTHNAKRALLHTLLLKTHEFPFINTYSKAMSTSTTVHRCLYIRRAVNIQYLLSKYVQMLSNKNQGTFRHQQFFHDMLNGLKQGSCRTAEVFMQWLAISGLNHPVAPLKMIEMVESYWGAATRKWVA